MIAFEPESLLYTWFRAWRRNIHEAKTNPQDAWVCCQAAVLAQAEYVMALAVELAKDKSR